MLSDTFNWLFVEHFKHYDKWPWSRFNALDKQIQEHASFVYGEFLFIGLVFFSLYHAYATPDPRNQRRLLLLWVSTFIVGTLNDYIFMMLPVVDNFWQAQAVIMLTPRMPLYIPCVYNAFMYWPLVAAARVFHHKNKCVIAEACLAGLLSTLFYAPYDVCGARLLWWTWHDSDPGVKLRWVGVPGGSTSWTLTFCFSLSLLFRIGYDLDWSDGKTLALTCISTPMMIVVLNIFTILGLDSIGQPGPQTVVATVIGFTTVVALRLIKPSLFESVADKTGLGLLFSKATTSRQADKLRDAEPATVFVPMIVYFASLCVIMAVFLPENQISTGTHQEFGPCDVTDVDLLGFPRSRYVCQDKYQDFYLKFDCKPQLPGATGRWAHVTPEESPTWYTVCGRPHQDFVQWLVTVVSLCITALSGLCLGYTMTDDDDNKND